MSHEYDDIIHLPHHRSKNRPPMSMHDRAAQFAPFAALTGYDAAIRETARRTEAWTELTEEAAEELNRKLLFLQERLGEEPEITVTYFVQDEKKPGGTYVTYTGQLRRIDLTERRLCFLDRTEIPMDFISGCSGAVFPE